MDLSVVVPSRNGARSLVRCLSALAGSTRPPAEVIVVDDGSGDETAVVARRLGARVLQVPDGPRGPAAARNLGAQAARGDVLVFVDSDVAVHADCLERMEAHLAANPDVAALFGSYDDDPPERGVASRYKNLLHHHTHQQSRREASTFWAGCGAIRRDVFLACGGYDERFRPASIEDIELGQRLRAAGHRLWSTPDVLSVHLKHWTVWGLVTTDIFRRAVPWSRLVLAGGGLPDDLNLSRRSRWCAAAAWSAALALVSALCFPWALMAIPPVLLFLALAEASLLRLFVRRGGLRFAIPAAGLHLLYYLYSSATFALVAAHHGLTSRRPQPAIDPTVCRRAPLLRAGSPAWTDQ